VGSISFFVYRLVFLYANIVILLLSLTACHAVALSIGKFTIDKTSLLQSDKTPSIVKYPGLFMKLALCSYKASNRADIY